MLTTNNTHGEIASPNPSYKQDVKTVTGEQEVIIRGKNIAKLDQTYNTNNAQITYSENVPSSIVGTKTQQVGQILATFTGQIEKGKTYTIGGTATQCYVYAYSDNIGGTIINSIQNLPLPVTFTANYTGFCLFVLYFRTLDTGTASIKNFQVEEGSTASTFEEYITPITKQLSLGDRKVYEGDYFWIDKNTGKKYHHHTKGDKTFTGASSEEWSVTQTAAGYRFRSPVSNIKRATSSSQVTDILCDKLIARSLDYIWNTGGNSIGIMTIADDVAICLADTSINTTEKLETFLSNNNLYAVYPLATETDEEITGTLAEQLEAWYNAYSNNGTTIIEINGTLPMIIKVRALKGE